MAEAFTSDHVLFATLTFNDENLHHGYGDRNQLLKQYVRNMRNVGYRFRYTPCFEFGSKNGRPHFHVLLFLKGGKKLDIPLNVRADLPGWTYGYSEYRAPKNVDGEMVASVAYLLKYMTDPDSIVFRSSNGMGKRYLENFAASQAENRRPLICRYGLKYQVAGARRKGKGGQTGRLYDYFLPFNHSWIPSLVAVYVDTWGELWGDEPPWDWFNMMSCDY